MKAVLGAKNRIKTVFANLTVGVESGFLHRDPKTVLFGAWMGNKFADNSRFLFQYLSENRKALGLNHVVWVTRREEIRAMLTAMGYEAYLCGTKESRYWHLKAGVHILCNATNRQGHDADIDIQYSWGAKKIQLWHGVGMKSVGEIANEHLSVGGENGLWKRLKSNRSFNMLISEGGWGEAYFLATSPSKQKVCQAIAGCSEESMFISNYPRNCPCIKLLTKEKETIALLQAYKGAVFYLPTFRKDYSHYVHPLTYPAVREFLINHHYVWIEKPHSASTYQFNGGAIENVLYLDASFDVNVLYPYVNMVISDYSSAVFDAVYRNIPVLMYTPDLEVFKNGNIGLSFDVETDCASVIVKDLPMLLMMIEEAAEGSYFAHQGRKAFYKRYRKEFWSDLPASYDQIWKDIKKKANIR